MPIHGCVAQVVSRVTLTSERLEAENSSGGAVFNERREFVSL